MSSRVCSLEEYQFEHHYDHVRGDEMLETFYVPMLERSLTYDRVAGYFSSAVLSHASAGFAKFCKSDNPRAEEGHPKFRLIVGARLNPKDEQVVLHAEDPELLEEVEQLFIKSIENIDLDEEFNAFEKRRFQGLSWMLQKGILEIKVGAMYDYENKQLLPHQEAEFHSKFGLVSDGENDLFFIGSPNETKRGWLDNYETIDVSCSWEGGRDKRTIQTYRQKFENLWNNERYKQGVVVVDFPDAAKLKILDKFPPYEPSGMDEVSEAKKRRNYIVDEIEGLGKTKNWYTEYDDKTKWRHQKHAVEWFLDPNKADGVGIFQMATGSGKTRTAIMAIRDAIKQERVNKAVIIVPKTLEEQWRDELYEHYEDMDLDPYWWSSSAKNYQNFFMDNHKNSVLIVSYYFVPKLLEFSKKNDVSKTMVVVDELHHVGSDGYKKGLKDDLDSDFEGDEIEEEKLEIEGLDPKDWWAFDCRLGLSATPWDMYDSTRNQYLVDGFVNGEFKVSDKIEEWEEELIDSERVFFFGLKEGIERGILCPFEYIPKPYTPSKGDFDRAAEAFTKVNPTLPPHLKKIMGMILAAMAFKTSREKIGPFEEWLREFVDSGRELKRCLMFVAKKDYGDLVEEKLVRDFHITDFRTFFEGEKMTTLKEFERGDIDSLIACGRISEGVDIKTVDTIVLFSADATRLQTIQRIGRALRTDPENPDKISTVVDFIWEGDDEYETADIKRRDYLSELAKTRRNE
jgi:superfamily II DNA or RNA helicase